MNVVILSKHDYGGSGYKIAQAVMKTNPDIRVDCFVTQGSRYGYNTGTIVTRDNYKEVNTTIRKADVIHYKGDDLPGRKWNEIEIAKSKPIVITLGGSGFRRHGGNCTVAMAWHPIEAYINVSQLRTTVTPDINYPELQGIYTPTPIDSGSQNIIYNTGRCICCGHVLPLVLSHSPSSRAKKGTDIVIRAVEKLKSQNIKFNFELIENLPHSRCVDRKKRASIFVDNVCPDVGAFGNSGLEAMQYGIPTIAAISKAAIEQSQGIYDDLPILNCHTKRDVYQKVGYYFQNTNKLRQLAEQTKAYTDKYHSYEAVGKMWRRLYENL
jgi:hypothetical protein